MNITPLTLPFAAWRKREEYEGDPGVRWVEAKRRVGRYLSGSSLDRFEHSQGFTMKEASKKRNRLKREAPSARKPNSKGVFSCFSG